MMMIGQRVMGMSEGISSWGEDVYLRSMSKMDGLRSITPDDGYDYDYSH